MVNDKAPSYATRPGACGYVQTIIDRRLQEHIDQRASEWAEQFSRKPDGSHDEELRLRIDREVDRRGAIGRQLDIYEPLRWTGLSFALTAAGGVAIKTTMEKQIAKPAIVALLAGTALNSAVQLLRLVPRYDSGLRGGVDAALAMHVFDKEQREGSGSAAPWINRVNEAPERPVTR